LVVAGWGILTPSTGAAAGGRQSVMEQLSTKRRAHLRSLAHALKPILHIGKDGVTDGVVNVVDSAFATRELLKIKVLDTSPLDAQESAEILAAHLRNAQVVQVIGKTIVLYRGSSQGRVVESVR
jgi:RNA-binding protein